MPRVWHMRCGPGAQVDLADLRLVPPIAGAFWTPLQPPPYDPTLPLYPMAYSDEEKQAQREAFDKERQGLMDAIAAGKSGYTFPPGVYRQKEKIILEVRTHATDAAALADRCTTAYKWSSSRESCAHPWFAHAPFVLHACHA